MKTLENLFWFAAFWTLVVPYIIWYVLRYDQYSEPATKERP